MRTVRMTRSELLTSRSRPLRARRIRMMTPLQSRVEWIVRQVCVSMMLIHPFDVPVMMWLPSAEKIVTHVLFFASSAACLAALAASTPSASWFCGRRGAEGRMRLIGFGLEMSTRTGWSSKSDATNSQLLPSASQSRRGCAVTYWLYGCSSATYTGASNRTMRTREPSLRSHRIHFQSCDELNKYRPSLDQLFQCQHLTLR